MKTTTLRQALLLLVLFVALLALIRVQQPRGLNTATTRTEPKLETDAENRPIAAILNGTQFGDDDLLRVVGIPWLQRIELAESRVTGRSLEKLKLLPKLKLLDLSGTSLTDDDFLPFTQLTTLIELKLNNCPWLKDEHLASLGELKKLRRLEVASPEITDRGLRVLGQFPDLNTLVIGDCAELSDALIETVETLPQLRELTLASANLSSQTVFTLHQKFPQIVVRVDLLAMKNLRTLARKGHLSKDGTSFQVISALIWVKHKDNIVRLWRGTESKMGKKKQELEE